MIRFFFCAVLMTFGLLTQVSAQQSIASYPAEWRDWPVIKESFLPSAEDKLPEDTPHFLQATLQWVLLATEGKGRHSIVYVNPSKVDEYRNQGPYSDGPTVVGVFRDAGMVFVTEHLFGEPVYGVYDLEGRDIAGQNPGLELSTCVSCHSGNADICRGGTCTIGVQEAFPAPTN